MRLQTHPFGLFYTLASMAAFLMIGVLPVAHAEQVVVPAPAAKPGRYMAVWDPPPFFVGNERVGAKNASLAAQECRSIVFRNSFEYVLWQGDVPIAGHQLPPGTAGLPIRYVTKDGFTIRIDLHRMSVQDPLERNKVEHWGDPHENLNGKHIKDWAGMAGWDGTRRTILLDGGAKVTMEAIHAQGVMLLTSIYDGQHSLLIDNSTNTILYYGTDAADTATRDAAQYDGETARFTVDTSTGVALYDNIYNEDANFNKVLFDVKLGETGGCANPYQVQDFFDDPRLPHT